MGEYSSTKKYKIISIEYFNKICIYTTPLIITNKKNKKMSKISQTDDTVEFNSMGFNLLKNHVNQKAKLIFKNGEKKKGIIMQSGENYFIDKTKIDPRKIESVQKY